ncbi:MAG: hypothetical protein IMW93_10525 [Thermoanaerobacteraceae bacterium]|nr:hypothetical protein [Thermoanaerobacteraceae bacterium]
MFFRYWPEQPGRNRDDQWRQVDEVEIRIGDVNMSMSRRSKQDIVAEFSAFIPRAEIRRRHYKAGEIIREDELILNSITIVHAPRHRPGEGAGIPSPSAPPHGSAPACQGPENGFPGEGGDRNYSRKAEAIWPGRGRSRGGSGVFRGEPPRIIFNRSTV